MSPFPKKYSERFRFKFYILVESDVKNNVSCYCNKGFITYTCTSSACKHRTKLMVMSGFNSRSKYMEQIVTNKFSEDDHIIQI